MEGTVEIKPEGEENRFFKMQQAILEIVANMKEVPQLPSEEPKEVNALLRVEFPDAGGVLTYMEGHIYPYRGFPYFEFVDKIDFIKKIIRGFLSGLWHMGKRRKFRLWTLIPSLWFLKEEIRIGVYMLYRLVERFRIKPIRYSQCIRELHRVFSLKVLHETERARDLRLQLRDLLCMLLEFDNAYRFRAQDILGELDQYALERNPIRELLRLMDILKEREKMQEIKDTWTLWKMAIKWYLRFDRELLGIFVSVFSHLDIEEFKLTEEDKYFSALRTDYAFGFKKVENTKQKLDHEFVPLPQTTW